jgi:predicted anti-sigma-YlaC factor YlaD
MDEKLDGDITSDDARALEVHLSACSSCRREWEVLVAVDRVLADNSLSRAPARFEQSVITEIARRVEARRRIESIGIPVACGVATIAAGYGVRSVVNWEAARSFVRGVGEAANGALTPLAEPLTRTPDFVTAWSQEPGTVGIVLAFAVAAVAFLGVSALRFIRQNALEWR